MIAVTATQKLPLLEGAGELDAWVSAHGGAGTGLGAPADWPPALRAAASILFGLCQPAVLAWGPERLCLYNEAYRTVAGPGHPDTLGRPLAELWSEAWPTLAPVLDRALAGAGAWPQGLPLPGSGGAPRLTVSCTPIRDGTGAVAGLFCTCAADRRPEPGEGESRQAPGADRGPERSQGESERAPGTDRRLERSQGESRRAPGTDRPSGRDEGEPGQAPDAAWEIATVERRRSDEALRAALRAGRSAAFETDLRTGHSVRSEMAGELLGLGSGPHRQFVECVLPEDRPAIARMFRAARESGQSCEAQVRFRHPDGRTIWLGIRMRVTCDESGAPATMSGLCTDITEQKEAQIRIAFQASLLDAVEQAVVATDPEGRIVYFNKFAERLYGWTAAEALGRDAGELTTGSAEDARSRAAAAGGGSWSGEIVLTRRDGTTFPAHMTDSPVFDPAGRPLGRVGVSYDLTERKQAEAELREKSVLLGATLENMDQGLVVADPDGRVSLFNRRALELMSLPLEFMARRPTLAEVKDFQLQRSEFATLDDALRGVAQSRHFLDDPSVYERARPDGTVLEFRTVRLPDGGAVRTYTDVTAWRQAEAELRASEERYRTLVTATSSILWRAKPDGSIFQVIGFDDYPGPQEDLLGYGWLDLIHPDDREEHACDWQAIVASDAPRESHYRFITANGDYRWVACRAVPLKGPDGTVREWAGYLTDIHERKQADEALRRSREELRAALEANRAIIEHSLDVICTLDEDGAFAQVSPRASDIWGYTPEELVGRRYIDLVHPDDVAMTDQVADRIMAGHPTFSFENRLVRKDGSAVPLLWSAVWSEEHRAMFCIARDLTERLRTEERLRQAQKMEAVGQLTGGIAHDFNNLLTVILGNAEILTEDASDPDRVRELATLILEASTRGADLTRHLLAFGRRQTLKPVRLHLDHVVHGLVPLLRRTLGEHIELRTEFVPCRLSALTDRTLLENALLNLVVNARDAMPHGGVLTISTAQRGAGPGEGPLPIGQDVVVVTVSDTGTGMSPEVMERVFEPFFTTKEVGKGSGLGLAMVYGFAQQCGGHVAIASKEGRGTAVTIVLPAIVGQAAEEGAAPIVVPRHTGKERVLLVEDEPQVLQFVSAQLLNLGYQVTAVTNGVDAVGILEQDRNFDLLLTDLVLPKGMSGIDLSQFARRIKPDLRVLYTSGYSEEVFRQHGRFEDSIPLLSKPYRGKELARMLRTVLDAPPVPLA